MNDTLRLRPLIVVFSNITFSAFIAAATKFYLFTGQYRSTHNYNNYYTFDIIFVFPCCYKYFIIIMGEIF